MTTTITQTYFLYYLEDNVPIPMYVGEAIDPAARFVTHQRDALDPKNSKEAYEHLRTIGHSSDFQYEVVPGVTEAELVRTLTLEGFRLYNANKGIGKAVKKKRDDTFANLNKQAYERTSDLERRNVLHNSAQQLTKSELVRQRIVGFDCTPEELDAMTWTPCPIELVEFSRGPMTKTEGVTCEYVKVGDYTVFVGFKPKHALLHVTKRGQEFKSYGVWHPNKSGQRLDVLKRMTASWFELPQ